jgi:N-acylneuraminate cytidylyltransferase
MKAIVPVKCNSERVKNKNFRSFYKGKSLFDIRIERLLKVLNPSDIYVSSEAEEVEKQSDKYGVNFMLRDEFLTKNDTPMSEVICTLVNNLPGNDDVIWSQVTEPMFSDFDIALQTWEKNRSEFDSLVVVKSLGTYLLDERGYGVNFHFGRWHQSSQTLPKWYILPFTFHVMKRETVDKCAYYIGSNPYLYCYNGALVDIDDEADFEQAQLIYEAIYD